MKKNLLLIASLILLCGSAWAQKLAPNAQILFAYPQQQESSLLKKVLPNGDSIKAFIQITNTEAIAQIEALGGEIHSILTDHLITAVIPLHALPAITAIDMVEYVQAVSPVELKLDEARRVSGVDEAHNSQNKTNKGAFTGKGVVIGIVDAGFEYGHIAFYTSDKSASRVKRVWNQNSSAGKHPAGYNYGTEYSNSDEIAAARYDDYSTFHGTHVAGIAAGGDKESPYYGVAPDAELVFVSYGESDANIVDGVKYCFEYAESVGKPCVVNLSLGSHFGPHDGTSVIDRTFDEITGPGRIIVGACGNEAKYNLHAGKKLTATDNQLKTMIGYENEADKRAILDVWGDAGATMSIKGVILDALKGQILAETKELSSVDNNGESDLLKVTSAEIGVDGWIGVAITVDPNNNRPNAFVQTQVTGMSTNRRVGIVVTGEEGDEIHLWNSSYGDLLNGNKRNWTAGDNNYTVGEIGGTGKSTISVGSYNTKLQYIDDAGYTTVIRPEYTGNLDSISIFSSIGPTLDNRMKPDVCAPGAVILAPASRYYMTAANELEFAADITTHDSQNYYYHANLGTSMASPFVTGTVALWLQANPELTPSDVRYIINKSAKKDSYTGDKSNNQWGAGKIDAYAGLLLAADPSSIEELEMAMSLLKVNANRETKTLQFFFADDNGEHNLNVNAYDSMGRHAATYHIDSNGQTVSTDGIPHGLYILHVECNGTHRSIKVIL